MEGVSYLFDNWQTANIRLDKIKLPAVLNLLPVSGTFNLGRQQLRDCPNCMMASWIKPSSILMAQKMMQ